jgi:hypothetical protein
MYINKIFVSFHHAERWLGEKGKKVKRKKAEMRA